MSIKDFYEKIIQTDRENLDKIINAGSTKQKVGLLRKIIEDDLNIIKEGVDRKAVMPYLVFAQTVIHKIWDIKNFLYQQNNINNSYNTPFDNNNSFGKNNIVYAEPEFELFLREKLVDCDRLITEIKKIENYASRKIKLDIWPGVGYPNANIFINSSSLNKPILYSISIRENVYHSFGTIAENNSFGCINDESDAIKNIEETIILPKNIGEFPVEETTLFIVTKKYFNFVNNNPFLNITRGSKDIH
ncbi:MAG: hypothetical protein QXG86_01430 [Candidatus Woesearchaeota archaeon]